jgi:hypothetical protein
VYFTLYRTVEENEAIFELPGVGEVQTRTEKDMCFEKFRRLRLSVYFWHPYWVYQNSLLRVGSPNPDSKPGRVGG